MDKVKREVVRQPGANLRPRFSFRNILANLDVVLALSVAVFALALTLVLLGSEGRFVYVVATVIGFLASLVYLGLRKHLLTPRSVTSRSLDSTGPVYLVLNILFFALFLVSILALRFRPDVYDRPLSYFIITIALVAILAAEILFLPDRKGPVALSLVKIIMLGLSLRSSPAFIFPSVLGFDGWGHSALTNAILGTGHILEGTTYSNLPVTHVVIAGTSLITGLDYRLASVFSVTVLQAICDLSFVFLIGRAIWSYKAGLLAALLLSIANQHLNLGWHVLPTTLAGTFMVTIIYLLFKQGDGGSTGLILLTLIFSVALILTHTLPSFTVSILMFIFCTGSIVYARLYRERGRPMVGISFVALYTVAMFAWWTYVSGHVNRVVGLVISTIFVDFEAGGVQTLSIPPELWQYMSGLPVATTVPYYLGMFLFFAGSIVGGAYLLAGKNINLGRLVYVIGGFVILLVGFLPFSSALGIMHRWWYLSQILLSVPVAIALLAVLALFKSRTVSVGIMAASISVLAFLMIMSPVANLENPAFSEGMSQRYALEQSELQAIKNIGHFWDGEIATDSFYWIVPATDKGVVIAEKADISPQLYTRDFATLPYKQEEMVLIRDEIAGHGFLVGGGYYKLDYDLFQTLERDGYARVYRCGSVSGYRYLGESTSP